MYNWIEKYFLCSDDTEHVNFIPLGNRKLTEDTISQIFSSKVKNTKIKLYLNF